LFTDISGQPISSTFEGQAVQELCQEQVDMSAYRGWCEWWLVLREEKESIRFLQHKVGTTMTNSNMFPYAWS